jgi:hypothetical protein
MFIVTGYNIGMASLEAEAYGGGFELLNDSKLTLPVGDKLKHTSSLGSNSGHISRPDPYPASSIS